MKLIRRDRERRSHYRKCKWQKTLFIQGPFLQTEMKNRNGRMYRMNVMEPEVGRYTESYINRGRALGELGHPDGPTINLDEFLIKL